MAKLHARPSHGSIRYEHYDPRVRLTPWPSAPPWAAPTADGRLAPTVTRPPGQPPRRMTAKLP